MQMNYHLKLPDQWLLKSGSKKAKPILLEPIMSVEVVTPEDYLGDVMGDLNSRRGKIEGFNARKDAQVIKSLVPLSEMFGYATSLKINDARKSYLHNAV
ncbi:MAG: hypothetical protein MZV64_21315 [Ignavibacteriales bacterium]|nr:hypothetical protein [Ignavibacteriales bacterium]